MLIALTITVVVQALFIVALVRRLRFRVRLVNSDYDFSKLTDAQLTQFVELTLAEQAQQI